MIEVWSIAVWIYYERLMLHAHIDVHWLVFPLYLLNCPDLQGSDQTCKRVQLKFNHKPIIAAVPDSNKASPFNSDSAVIQQVSYRTHPVHPVKPCTWHVGGENMLHWQYTSYNKKCIFFALPLSRDIVCFRIIYGVQHLTLLWKFRYFSRMVGSEPSGRCTSV